MKAVGRIGKDLPALWKWATQVQARTKEPTTVQVAPIGTSWQLTVKGCGPREGERMGEEREGDEMALELGRARLKLLAHQKANPNNVRGYPRPTDQEWQNYRDRHDQLRSEIEAIEGKAFRSLPTPGAGADR